MDSVQVGMILGKDDDSEVSSNLQSVLKSSINDEDVLGEDDGDDDEWMKLLSQRPKIEVKTKQFKIKSHHPEKFAKILQKDGYTYQDIIESMNIKKNKKKIFNAGEGAGASGSFFFFSADNRLIIKTMQDDDLQAILEIVDDYIKHLTDVAGKSLLARIYGVYTIYSTNFVPVHIMVM